MTGISDLQSAVRAIKGRAIVPGDPGYDEARKVFLGGVDKRPSLIVRVADADDVCTVVQLARDTGLELAIRSGGHSNAGHSTTEGGLVLDLSAMKGLDVDVAGRTCWAEAGLTAAELSNALSPHGLVIGFGDTGSVGIGGITTGGGIGYLARKFGMTIDSLLAADVVTADGDLVRTSSNEHPDLFWAIRGGGGNFGVVTRFQYRLSELRAIVGGMLIQPATAETVAAFIALSESAPDELTTIANVMPCPPMPFVAEEHHGKLVNMALITYAGGLAEAEPVLGRLRAIAEPLADLLKPMPYAEIYPPDDPSYNPLAAARTMFLDRVDEPVAQTILDWTDEHMRTSSPQMCGAQLRVLGGAIARVPADATAYAHRSERVMANLFCLYGTPEEGAKHEAWIDRFRVALDQGNTAAYVNFIGDEGPERIHDAYPRATLERLASIKRRYDPSNLFRLNQNIAPA